MDNANIKESLQIGSYKYFPREGGIGFVYSEIKEEQMNNLDLRKIERKARRDLDNYVREVTPEMVLELVEELKRLRNENIETKNEIHILKERLDNYIPRRRVRRVFKQLKKILEQDGVTDDLELDD